MKTILAIAAMSVAFAVPAAAKNDAPSVSIDVSDLNLTTSAGQDKLDRRIDLRVRKMCRTAGFDALSRKMESDCRVAARADAKSQVELAIANARAGRFASNTLDIQG